MCSLTTRSHTLHFMRFVCFLLGTCRKSIFPLSIFILWDVLAFYLSRPIVRDLVDDVIIVEDKAIVEAMRLCYEILKVVVEPSGAIGLAAVLSDDFRNNPAWKDCSNIGIVLSGGNVDLDVLWDSFRK